MEAQLGRTRGYLAGAILAILFASLTSLAPLAAAVVVPDLPAEYEYYLAGYDDEPLKSENALKMIINFGVADPTVIQVGNWLEAGFYSTVFTINQGGIDYSYQAYARMYRSGGVQVFGEVWRNCEGTIYGCGPQEATLLSQTALTIPYYRSPTGSWSASDDLTLTMKWQSGQAKWYYQLEQGATTLYKTYTPPANSQTVFNVGTLYHAGTGHLVKYFQFGIAGKATVPCCWQIMLRYPQYSLDGVGWATVPKAKSVWGSQSWLDATGRYGVQLGGYPNANADYNAANPTFPKYWLLFYRTTSTLPNAITLWQ
jgi:hypothetical protein